MLWLLIAVVFPGVSRWIKKHNRRADEAADEPSGANLEDLNPDYRARGSVLKHSMGESARPAAPTPACHGVTFARP